MTWIILKILNFSSIEYFHTIFRFPVAPESFLRHVFYPFYAHMTPYFIGMMTAYAVDRTPEIVIRLKKYLSSTLVWFISLGILAGTIVGYFPFFSTLFKPSRMVNAIFLSTHHLGWSISLAWTVLACHCGEGGFINKILTLQLWKPLARIGLSIYLINVSVLMAILGSQEQPAQFDELLNAHHYLGDLGISFIIGLHFYFLIEAPFISIFNSFSGDN